MTDYVANMEHRIFSRLILCLFFTVSTSYMEVKSAKQDPDLQNLYCNQVLFPIPPE